MHAVWERRVAFRQRQRKRNLRRLQRIAGGGQAFQRVPYAVADLGGGQRCLRASVYQCDTSVSLQTWFFCDCADSEITVCPVTLLECCATLRCFRHPHLLTNLVNVCDPATRLLLSNLHSL